MTVIHDKTIKYIEPCIKNGQEFYMRKPVFLSTKFQFCKTGKHDILEILKRSFIYLSRVELSCSATLPLFPKMESVISWYYYQTQMETFNQELNASNNYYNKFRGQGFLKISLSTSISPNSFFGFLIYSSSRVSFTLLGKASFSFHLKPIPPTADETQMNIQYMRFL